VYYGGVFVANKNLTVTVVPLPRSPNIQPLVVTSRRDVTRVITCSAEFPPLVGRDAIRARVTWSVKGDKTPVRDGEWISLRPGNAAGLLLEHITV